MLTKKFLILVDLLKKHYNAKITDIESKIPSIPGLATIAALTTVENKIPDVGNLVKLDLKIKQKGLVNKSDIAGFVNNADLDKKKKQH